VYSVETDRGHRNAVSMLEPDWAMDHGLNFEAIVGFVVADGEVEPTAATLREHSTFLRVLSRVIYEEAEREPELCFEADVQREGFPYLLDRRAPDPGGRVAPEDIIGTVDVRSGTIVPGSFQHNPRHRILTTRGFFRLSPMLEVALDVRLRAPARYLWWPDACHALSPE
jgi:hypothetical protein